MSAAWHVAHRVERRAYSAARNATFAGRHLKFSAEAREKACDLCPLGKSCQLDRAGKKACQTRNAHWHPTLEEFTSFTSQPCAYCGATFPYVGVDRIQNCRGYEEGNLAPCCWTCNEKKNSDTFEEWRDWAMRFAAFAPTAPIFLA